MIALIVAAVTVVAGSHIKISSCTVRLSAGQQITQSRNLQGGTDTQELVVLGKQPGITVEFTNDAKVAATDVEFTYVSRGRALQNITDTGTFAPGMAISHRFPVRDDLSILDTGGNCVVTRVMYADGSSWRNPTATAP